MKRFMFLLLAIAIMIPVPGESASGMAAMQYYVGRWNCMAGAIGQSPSRAQLTYTLDSGILRTLVYVPAQARMKRSYTLSFATTYDAKHDRYVQASNDTDGASAISFIRMPNDNLEQWTDYAAANQKLGHGRTVRYGQNNFTVMGYPSLTSMRADFKAVCRRSS